MSMCKGISLSLQQWKTLSKLASMLNKTIAMITRDELKVKSLEECSEFISVDTEDMTVSFSVHCSRA